MMKTYNISFVLSLLPGILFADDCVDEAKSFVATKQASLINGEDTTAAKRARQVLVECLNVGEATTIGVGAVFSNRSMSNAFKINDVSTKPTFLCAQRGNCYEITVTGGKPTFRVADENFNNLLISTFPTLSAEPNVESFYLGYRPNADIQLGE